MRINNKKKIAKLKRVFYAGSGIIGILIVSLFLFNLFIPGLIGIGVFGLWFLYFQVADFQYIEYRDENGKIVFRFYKAVKFGRTEYQAIEFPHTMLKKAWFENSIFGKKSDVTLIVRTKRGLAEYPSVSLTALSLDERNQMEASMNRILKP